MKKILTAIICIAAVFAGCSKDDSDPAVQQGSDLIVTATFEKTKVSFTEETNSSTGAYDYIPSWEVNDEVFGIVNGSNAPVTFKVASTTGSSATLAYVSGTAPVNNQTVTLVYAPGKTASDLNGTTLAIDYSTQNGSIPAVMMAQATVADNHLKLHFYNKAAILAVRTFKGLGAGSSQSIVKAKVSGTGLNTGATLDLANNTVGNYTTGDITMSGFSIPVNTSTWETTAPLRVVFFPSTTGFRIDATDNYGNPYFTKIGSTTVSASDYVYATKRLIARFFTVDQSANPKKVVFSPGNLNYDFGSGKYGFNGPTESLLGTNGNVKDDQTGKIDLFAWPVIEAWDALLIQYCRVGTFPLDLYGRFIPEGQYFGYFNDWGHNSITCNPVYGSSLNASAADYWSTLTSAEWIYLVNRSGGPGHDYDFVTINSQTGLLIYPDGYTKQATASVQEKLDDGCVFLPPTGLRLDNTNVIAPDNLLYWSATTNFTSYSAVNGVWTGRILNYNPGPPASFVIGLDPQVHPGAAGHSGNTGGIGVRLVHWYQNGEF